MTVCRVVMVCGLWCVLAGLSAVFLCKMSALGASFHLPVFY